MSLLRNFKIKVKERVVMNRKLFLLLVGFFVISKPGLSACQNLFDCSGINFSGIIEDGAESEVEDIVLQEITHDDGSLGHKGLDKYDFIASKLGIIGKNSATTRRALGKFFKAFASPAMVASYFTAVVIGKNFWDWEVSEQLIYGITLATSTQLICTGIGEWLDNTADQKAARVQNVIANWPSYKAGSPEELYQLFDGLYALYANSGRKLDVSQELVDQVIKKVASGYIEFLAQQKLDA